MKRFVLNRNKDVSGISGTGEVAAGVEFDDGQVVLSWHGRFHTIEVLPNAKALMDIHGHGGSTEVKWLD